MFDYKEWWMRNRERVIKHRLNNYHNNPQTRLMYRLRAALWYHTKQLSSLLTPEGKIKVDKSSHSWIYSKLPTEVVRFYRTHACIELYLALLYIKSSGLKLSIKSWIKLLTAVLHGRIKTKEGVISYAKKLQRENKHRLRR